MSRPDTPEVAAPHVEPGANGTPVAPGLPPEAQPWEHGVDWRIFRVVYKGQPRNLRAYLLERYSYGRDEAWRAGFYPERVRLNGQPVDQATEVHPGDEIGYRHLRADEPPPEGPPPAVLHEDDWLLALHKPEWVPVNPSGVYYYRCLVIAARERTGNPELSPLHRLDLETSGPVLFAKRRSYVRAFQRGFTEQAVAKRYRALVLGHFPPELEAIAGYVVPDTASAIHTRLRLSDEPPRQNGPTAPEISRTRVLQVDHRWHKGAAYSELLLAPLTGKTNQLRVHLAHVGHPIVGDKKYHPDEGVFLDWLEHRKFSRLAGQLWLPRQALHCESLGLQHPYTGEELVISASPGSWQERTGGLRAGA